jgi:hypothetical protein
VEIMISGSKMLHSQRFIASGEAIAGNSEALMIQANIS